VYIARTDALPNIVKIGATRRTAEKRLYELSRCVPKPFQLLKWIPASNPFALEHKLHRYFSSRRLKESGAGTEFFEIDAKDLDEIPAQFLVPPSSLPGSSREY
jgi:hypothetical protein